MTSVAGFSRVILYTDVDGRARFREERIALTEGTPQAMLSPKSWTNSAMLLMVPATPTMVRSVPFTCSRRPSTAGSAPSTRCQKR